MTKTTMSILIVVALVMFPSCTKEGTKSSGSVFCVPSGANVICCREKSSSLSYGTTLTGCSSGVLSISNAMDVVEISTEDYLSAGGSK
jgi:hypothetical protein